VFDRLMTTLAPDDIVSAWALDRLTRRGMEQAGQILRVLEERGARLVTVSDGIDTAQDFGTCRALPKAYDQSKYSTTFTATALHMVRR
jgi:DNA invertase Pin-like site-specific DNA recombinase